MFRILNGFLFIRILDAKRLVLHLPNVIGLVDLGLLLPFPLRLILRHLALLLEFHLHHVHLLEELPLHHLLLLFAQLCILVHLH